MSILDEIAAERRRQIDKGFDAAHDDDHDRGELGIAAALYAIPYDHPQITQGDYIGLHATLEVVHGWTLHPEPDARKRLITAAALIVAELERLDRAAA